MSGFRPDMKGAFVQFDEALEDTQAEPGAIARMFGGEERLKNLRQYLWRNARAGIADTKGEDWRAVFEALDKNEPLGWTIREPSQVQRVSQEPAFDMHLMKL